VAFFTLGLLGLIRLFTFPTGAMSPAVSPGDHVLVERFTFLSRKPRRGDVVVFKTRGIESLPDDQFYAKRVAGEPGEHLRISDGTLFINDTRVALSNAFGEIKYVEPPIPTPLKTDVTVPPLCYYMLGDNSRNSSDSRSWGSVPNENIVGRICFCYWPPSRMGRVR
jgi:signal peptidase I